MAVTDIAAVVRVAGVDVVIDRLEAHVTIAHACEKRDRLQPPFALDVGVAVAHVVILVPTQIAKRPIIVDEALARLPLAVVVGSDRQRQRPAGGDDTRRRAKVDTGEVA